MIHFIRDRANRTIVDVEVFRDEQGYVELSSTIMIEPYSKFLIENLEDDLRIMNDFSKIQELRGWLWDTVKQGQVDEPTLEDVNTAVANILKVVADEYELHYVVD